MGYLYALQANDVHYAYADSADRTKTQHK